MSTCPRAHFEEVCCKIERSATEELTPIIESKINELSLTLSLPQRKLLGEIEDLYALQAGKLVQAALEHKGCAKF